MSDSTQQYLRRAGLQRLFQAARVKVEQHGHVAGYAQLSALSADEAQEINGLLYSPAQRRPPLRSGEDARIKLTELEQALQSPGLQTTLTDALVELGGPLRDLPAERLQERQEHQQLWDRAAQHPVVLREDLGGWLEQLRSSGTLKSYGERREDLLRQALAVLDQLPADGIERARLAALVTGDAHALDLGRPLNTLVELALAFQQEVPRPKRAMDRRKLWAQAGVVLDSVSSDVLVLNLPLQGDTQLAQTARLWPGTPIKFTYGQVAEAQLRVPPGAVVSICENPAVLTTAASVYGGRCAPMVCLAGLPSAAGRLLLEALREQATLRYHGDFDREGVLIAEALQREHGVQPWRFDEASYLGALEQQVAHTPKKIQAEPDSSPLMRCLAEHGAAIYEEALLDVLLEDLID